MVTAQKLILEDRSVTSGKKITPSPLPQGGGKCLPQKEEGKYLLSKSFSKPFLSGITQRCKSNFSEGAQSSARRKTHTTIYTSGCQVIPGR